MKNIVVFQYFDAKRTNLLAFPAPTVGKISQPPLARGQVSAIGMENLADHVAGILAGQKQE